MEKIKPVKEMNVMLENKNIALTGASKKRLNNMYLRNIQSTAPIADTNVVTQEAKLTFPSEEDVKHAKEWIDNGSCL